MGTNIKIFDEFILEKMTDKFVNVIFTYGAYKWVGAIPKKIVYQGFEINEKEEFQNFIQEAYKLLEPLLLEKWIGLSDDFWGIGKEKKSKGPTYNVLKALYSGEWECRVCGPVPQVNPQPAARLRDLRKMGYVIASKRKECNDCGKTTMHDLLVKLPIMSTRQKQDNELRSPISLSLRYRIISILGYKEVCYNQKRSKVELLIDHKFPSQRWRVAESKNNDDMPEETIKQKFQLLSNQSNMLKSRYCDRCVKESIRGDYMGIEWFYSGNENWKGKPTDDETGCIGCPWYDLEEWKKKLKSQLLSN